jgi:HD-GYP domain-containing protein (c-di-GMP phosphodiesterase class II)
VLAATALAALGVAVPLAARPTSMQLGLAAVFVGLVAVAYLRPLHFAHKTKVSLGTSVLFAAVLLFDPALAMVIGLAGVAIAHLAQREPAIQTAFNVSQIVLEVAIAGALLWLTDWKYDGFEVGTPAHLLGMAGAMAAIYLSNTVMVAGIVSLQTRLSFWHVWLQSVSFGHAEDGCQFILGLLAAVMIDVHAWTLPLFLLPAVVLHRSMAQHIQLRQQTVDALEALADVVDLRDPYTANHSRRVAVYARELATELELDPDEVDLIERAARVHDVGKLVVDQVVLSKPGKLDPSEWDALKQHPVTGAEILSRFPLLALATSYVLYHHEAIDGGGYPHGLAGDAIPLGARIIAVADSFDAMASARPYRGALPRDVVLREFETKAGVQWDAAVVDALLTLVAAGRITFPGDATTPHVFDRHGQLVPLPAAV